MDVLSCNCGAECGDAPCSEIPCMHRNRCGTSGCVDGTTAALPGMTVKHGAFALCACVSGEVTWIHSAHTCCSDAVERFVEGPAELVRLSYDTASSVQAGVASSPMTRALNCVTSRMVSQFHKHVRLVKALGGRHPRRPKRLRCGDVTGWGKCIHGISGRFRLVVL
jgi:hypothetical protein